LTDLVEAAVLLNLTESRNVVFLGAMETMYQRSKIQEESLYYETLKHTGELWCKYILSSKGSPTVIPAEVIRATERKIVPNHNVGELA
jgi:methylmalonyl-CoA mutase